MTTIDAAAVRHVPKLVANAALIAMLALGATGCSSGGGSNVLSTFGLQSANNASTPTATATATAPKGTVSIAPIIGPPDNVSGQLSQQLTSSLQKNGIQVVSAKPGASAAKGDYTLRGYIVAAREAKGTKVSYIWDVTNPGGQRVNRITGEELADGAVSADPWSSISPPVVRLIANKTASSLSAWMPKKSAPKPQAAPAVASGPKPAPVQAAAASTPPAAQPAQPATTASISKASSLTVVIPRVSGAPGDGPTALARALQAELRKKGIPLAGAGANPPSAHRVEGNVVMGASKGGKQPISIDWVVKAPGGAKLGTVSQKNEIPAGSLNSKWGPTAGAAAAAAAEGIVRLLPKKT